MKVCDSSTQDFVWERGIDGFWVRDVVKFRAVPRYTASVDAALALVERKLPGWVVADLSQNSRHAGDPWGCQLACYFGSDPSKNRAAASGHDYPQPALAIVAALLQALKDSSHE